MDWSFLKSMSEKENREDELGFLVCRYLNSLDFDKGVIPIANRLKVKIPHYKTISSYGPNRDKFFLTVMAAVEKFGFRFTTNKTNIEAYRTMQKKNLVNYHIQIMVDIAMERNTDILKELLGPKFFIIPEDYESYDFRWDEKDFTMAPPEMEIKKKEDEMDKEETKEEVEETETVDPEVEKLQAEVERLAAERDQMVKEKRKFRQDKEKAEEQAKKDRDEVKAYANRYKAFETQINEFQQKLEYLQQNMAGVMEERDRLRQENENLQKQLAEQMGKYAYMEKIAKLKNVLLLNLNPREEGAFPYQYKSLPLSMDLETWPEDKFTEVWYCEGGMSSIILAAALEKIKAKYGLLDVLNFEQQSLVELDLEVLA